MADASTAITVQLELTDREASALAEFLVWADWENGEGDQLEAIYDALIDSGVERGGLEGEVNEEDEVVITRVEEL